MVVGCAHFSQAVPGGIAERWSLRTNPSFNLYLLCGCQFLNTHGLDFI